jgi:hypothetical protein
VPNKPGLALLVRMCVLKSGLHTDGRRLPYLTATGERLDSSLVLALVSLEYLTTNGPAFYELTPKGFEVGTRVAPRQQQRVVWAAGSHTGKKLHYWTEYTVLGKYTEYEAVCGQVSLSVHAGLAFGLFCRECRTRFQIEKPAALTVPPADLLFMDDAAS